MRLLLAHGAKVDAVEPYKGQTALMWAAAEGTPRAVEALLEAGARQRQIQRRVHAAPVRRPQRAHRHARSRCWSTAPTSNELAPDGTSALNMAIVNAYYELASVLLDHGADPNLPDPRASPLHTVAWLREAGRRRRRRRRQHAARHAGPHRQRDRPGARAQAARARRESERARRLARADVRQGGRHGAQPAEHPSRSASPQL